MNADKLFFLIYPYGSFPCKYRCVTFWLQVGPSLPWNNWSKSYFTIHLGGAWATSAPPFIFSPGPHHIFFSPPSFTSIVLQFDASSRRRFFLLGAVAGALLLTVKKDLLFTWPAVSCSCTLRGPFVLACRRGSLSAVSMYFCKRTQDTFPHYGP